jgi:hypothetical protein
VPFLLKASPLNSCGSDLIALPMSIWITITPGFSYNSKFHSDIVIKRRGSFTIHFWLGRIPCCFKFCSTKSPVTRTQD